MQIEWRCLVKQNGYKPFSEGVIFHGGWLTTLIFIYRIKNHCYGMPEEIII